MWYYRLRKTLGTAIRPELLTRKGWSSHPLKWDESNIWDVWFRSLALAEIANTIELDNDFGLREVYFQKNLGLAYFAQ